MRVHLSPEKRIGPGFEAALEAAELMKHLAADEEVGRHPKSFPRHEAGDRELALLQKLCPKTLTASVGDTDSSSNVVVCA
jgi:hypothetical protein